MGSGCSSPIRKMGKSRKHSSGCDINANVTSASGASYATAIAGESGGSGANNELNIDIVEDHPSTGSYSADARLLDECKRSGHMGPNPGGGGGSKTAAAHNITSPSLNNTAATDLASSPDQLNKQAHASSFSNNNRLEDQSKDKLVSTHSSASNHSSSTTTTRPATAGGGAPPAASQAVSHKPKIFVIDDNHSQVIVIFPDKNCLTVYDIYEQKTVKTVTNLDMPNNLRMIDHRQCVLLCNRELRVYDLESGELLTKLKGVMNQKMPYFEVYDKSYVIALARNRMYVNMLNLSNGELETTFKVGEDRFLNSLLVSRNGGICVCGDETQKPFPLLVWNLNERRLMYDLRLNRHEFLTSMSIISEDGHFVVSVCRQLGDFSSPSAAAAASSMSGAEANNGGGGGNCTTPPNTAGFKSPIAGAQSPSIDLNSRELESAPNFIVVYDLNSGTLFKKWKPGIDTCSVTVSSTSADDPGVVANGLVDGSICVWDLTTGSRRHILLGHKAPPDVLKARKQRLFSMDSQYRDRSLRVWDMEQGTCLSVFSPSEQVASCQISMRGDALVCGFKNDKKLVTLFVDSSSINSAGNSNKQLQQQRQDSVNTNETNAFEKKKTKRRKSSSKSSSSTATATAINDNGSAAKQSSSRKTSGS